MLEVAWTVTRAALSLVSAGSWARVDELAVRVADVIDCRPDLIAELIRTAANLRAVDLAYDPQSGEPHARLQREGKPEE